jgi:hypothetical protein
MARPPGGEHDGPRWEDEFALHVTDEEVLTEIQELILELEEWRRQGGSIECDGHA